MGRKISKSPAYIFLKMVKQLKINEYKLNPSTYQLELRFKINCDIFKK